MVYKSEILTGIDANIARVQDRLNAELPWAANCDIFGRISINKKNNSSVFEWYNGSGEYKEIFINDQKSIIGFLVDETRAISQNEVDVTVIFSIYIPLTYLDTINHDEHVLMDAQRVLRNCGLIRVNQINTDFENIYTGVNINRIQHSNLYPFVNFAITGTMRFVDKCLNYVIARSLSYSAATATYAVDADYNDIIRCSLTVTNNTSVAQNCIVYFKHNDYYVQLSAVIPENSSYTFTYDFEDVDIYVENIVTFHDSAMIQVGSVTLAATVRPVFEMFYTSGTLSFRTGRYVESFITYLQLENGTTREVAINDNGDTTYISISQVYALGTSKNISILNPLLVDYLYAVSQANLTINYNQIEKLRNLTYLTIGGLSNCYIAQNNLSRLTKLLYLNLQTLPNCYVAQHVIEKLTKLSFLYLFGLPNCYITIHEIEKLTELTNITIATTPNCFITQYELSALVKINKTTQIYIAAIGGISIASNEQFPTHYLLLNNSNMTSTDVDNVFISCYNQLLTGFVPGTKNINTAGATNAKVTAASLTARNYLVAQGYTLTYNS